jgi:phosphoribosylaminoimidazolecarboxamide formyltransferase/IMP cyclohydrolase
MSKSIKIKSALISVFNKTGIIELAQELTNQGITIYSTGGTQAYLEQNNIPVIAVETLTNYPSILGGRVKTLHPKIFGGILARPDNKNDLQELAEFNIPEINLVIVDLYPFEETLKSGGTESEIIEKIDIGGVSLLRAAAKNYNNTAVISSNKQYKNLIEELKKGKISAETRKQLATEAFNLSSHYDTAIFNYFNSDNSSTAFKQSFNKKQTLRYGENPHQKGTFFGNLDEIFNQLHGKQLSYNNLLDIDAAVNLMAEYTDTTFAILKHNNACGLSSRPNLADAYTDALAGDPISAFGGVLITNREIDLVTAKKINTLFCEVVIAPSYNKEALALLKSKKNRIILVQKTTELPSLTYRTALNGVLVQARDDKQVQQSEFKTVGSIEPTPEQKEDLFFANKLAKHTKSNTIVLAKKKQLLASGTGQTSRVDALEQAIHKAKTFNFDLQGAVMASDAFFPFSDCVAIAAAAGIKAVIQPGGSIKDNDSTEACNKLGLAMIHTGFRHFKH